MRAEDLLPEHVNTGEFNGVTVRKGTVGAFLVNTRIFLDPCSPIDTCQQAEADMIDALPALCALGIFDAFEMRDLRLRNFVREHVATLTIRSDQGA